MKFILIILLFLITENAFCERTKGLTKVFNFESNVETVNLFSNVEINCGPRENNLINISFWAYTDLEYFNEFYPNQKRPVNGVSLYDSSGKKIGIVISDSLRFQNYVGKSHNKFLIKVYGQVLLENLKDSVFPEMFLKKILNLSEKNLTITKLKNAFPKYEINKSDNYLELKGYQFYYYSVEDFYNYRIELLFKDKIFVGIMYSRLLNTDKGVKFEILDDNLGIVWLSNSIDEKERFIKKYKEIMGRECCGG